MTGKLSAGQSSRHRSRKDAQWLPRAGTLRLWFALCALLGGCGLTPTPGPPVIVGSPQSRLCYDSFGALTSTSGCGGGR